jgi:CRP-like cAMP-binding protein
LLLRYVLAFQTQVTQTAACNGHHALDQRLARWLLIAHDRAEGDEFPMTQEFLATMLCVHRPGVTVAARLFQQAGLIRYSSGRITITDRAGLEAASCECHGVVAREFQRLLGPMI